MTGIDLIRAIKRINPDTQVLIMTSEQTYSRVQEALKAGAFDYLEKPFKGLDIISGAADRAIKMYKMIVRNREMKRWVDENTSPGR